MEIIRAGKTKKQSYDKIMPELRSKDGKRGISMTLQEFIEKAFRNPASKESVKIYVFDDEDSAESWIECKYNGAENYGFEIAMVIQSDYRADVFLKDIWLNAEIQQFYVVEADTIAVVVNVEA